MTEITRLAERRRRWAVDASYTEVVVFGDDEYPDWKARVLAAHGGYPSNLRPANCSDWVEAITATAEARGRC